MVIASAIRIWSAQGDMWFDEIWSLNSVSFGTELVASDRSSVVFFHPTTHLLNSLYLAVVNMILGDHAPEIVYRFLSIVSGIGTVWIAALIGRRQGASGALIAGFMVAISYPLVHYSGEARGFSTMMFAALASTYALDQYLSDPIKSNIRNFVIFTVLGLISHPAFIVMLVGLGLWASAHIFLSQRSTVETFRRLVPLFGVQCLTLAAYGVLVAGNVTESTYCCFEPAMESLRIITLLAFGINGLYGAPDLPFWGLYLFITVGIVWLARQRQLPAILLCAVVILFPLIVVIAENQASSIHRDFLLSALMALMVFAGILSHLWELGKLRRVFAGMILVFFALSNGALYLQSTAGGRGQYSAVIRDIVSGENQLQRVTGYPSANIEPVFEYYVNDQKLSNGVIWIPEENQGSVPADWVIHGNLGRKYPDETIERSSTGTSRTYSLHGIYPPWGLSGDTWALYWLEPRT